MADAIDAAQLLDVDMDQFTGALALIADDLGLRVEGGDKSQAATAQDEAVGGGWALQPARDDGTTEA